MGKSNPGRMPKRRFVDNPMPPSTPCKSSLDPRPAERCTGAVKRRQRWLWALVFAWVCFAAPAAEALVGPGQGGTAEARAGADPDDVEMAVRGLNASVSIFNLTQGMNFRSKNNRMCFVSGTPAET